ncbi:MAG: hypothetical protein AB1720_07665 [Pseudomonadota bacterium]
MDVRFAALLLAAAFAGCATPQYQTTVRVVPPTDAAGRACVQDCEKTLAACQTGCRARYETCAQSVEPQVEARYVEALKRYEAELQQYAAALRQYEMQLRFEWMHGYPYYWPYGWGMWPAFPPPYREPKQPTREGVRAQLVKETCQDDCGCLPAFDACFVGCGGQRISETRCIRNCPPAQ